MTEKKGSAPLVSVVVPNYNYAHFLNRRLDSIINQTFNDLEVIYIDDASTDGSLEVVKGYAEKVDLHIHANSKNSGSPFPLWNRGVELARGKYVWIAESDDYAEPEFLEVLLRRLKADSGLGMAYCQSKIVDENEQTVGSMLDYTDKWWPGRWAESFRNNGRDEVARYLIHHNTIPNVSAVLFRREAYLEAGGADPEMRLCGDWMTYARILFHWDIYFAAGTLNNFRVHEKVTRKRMSGDPREIRERYAVLDEILRNVPVKGIDRRKALESRMYFWADLAEKRGWPLNHPEMRIVKEAAARVDPMLKCRFLKKKLLKKLKIFLSDSGLKSNEQ